MSLGAFIERCGDYFAWSGSLVSQPYVPRLRDGMIRCYLVQGEVVGFCHQRPRGLLDSDEAVAAPTSRSTMEGPEAPAYRSLRKQVENEWVPQMLEVLGLEADMLPAIWDADFLYGPRTASGADTYVLCEINVSAVWPFPPQAIPRIAAAATARMESARALRG